MEEASFVCFSIPEKRCGGPEAFVAMGGMSTKGEGRDSVGSEAKSTVWRNLNEVSDREVKLRVKPLPTRIICFVLFFFSVRED